MGTYDTFFSADQKVQIQSRAFHLHGNMESFTEGEKVPNHYPKNCIIKDDGEIWIHEGIVREVSDAKIALPGYTFTEVPVYDSRGQLAEVR